MKNIFTYRGRISRIGIILILIGVFLSIISFVKGIQILMFIPALVISLFLYSFLEVKKLKKYVLCNLLKEGDNFIITIKSPSNVSFFFRVGCKKGEEIILLSPDSTHGYFNITYHEDIEIIILMNGTFDILRNIINIGKINQIGVSESRRSSARDYKNNTFFFVREYESGDNLSRLDSIKSALKNTPFIKSLVNFDISKKNSNSNDTFSKLLIKSNQILDIKDDTSKGNILKWILILINFIIIYIEWGNILLNAFILFPAIFIIFFVYKKKYVCKNLKILNLIIFGLFILMIFMTFVMRDMTGPGSVFLTQILIFKQLFLDEREDGFLYIFLSLFVFVAVSLFSIQLWFILFFLVYLAISVSLLTSVSGYMVTDPIRGAFGTKNSNFDLFKTTIFILICMVLLFFILPHGNKQESGGSLIAPQNTKVISGFSNELDLKNVEAIKTDTSKVITIDNLGEDEKYLLKNSYWRGVRFYLFRNSSWIKSDENKIYKQEKKDTYPYKNINISYLLKGSTNLFLPNIPTFIDFGSNSEINFLRLNTFDNSIFFLPNKSTKPINLKVSFIQNTDGKLIDTDSQYSYSHSGARIDKNTLKLFSRFWDTIDRKKYNTPAKLTTYIRNIYGFRYSIDAPAKNMEDFLYGSKKGHCEYFATVLALTLQHFGYDATVVNGYYGGEWNDLAKYWIIRGKDAHSWVEVYNGSSWQIYDATPNEISLGVLPFYVKTWNYLVSVYDYLDLKWYTYVVNYSGDVQRSLILQIISFKYSIISVIFVILIILVSYHQFLIFRLNRSISYEEKLLKYLKKNTKNNFPLSRFGEADISLVTKTRDMIYKNERLSPKDYKKLKSDWKEYFSKIF